MTDQSLWPPHLRDAAPSQRCGRCHRKTWDTEFVQPWPEATP